MSAKNPEEELPDKVGGSTQPRSTLWLAVISAALASGGLHGMVDLVFPLNRVATPYDGAILGATLLAFIGAVVTGAIVLRRIMPGWRGRGRYLEFMLAGFGCWAGVIAPVMGLAGWLLYK